jgi:hypothetical protein
MLKWISLTVVTAVLVTYIHFTYKTACDVKDQQRTRNKELERVLQEINAQ